MGRLINETDLMNLLCALDDARHDLFYAIKKIPELPTVDAIPKDEYEARLKADLKAILVELQLEIEELDLKDSVPDYQKGADETREYIADLFQQKINAIEGSEDDRKDNI